MNPKVDDFLSKVKQWKTELEKLRTLILECGLVEELKWGVPCYTYQKANILLIHGFKEYFAIAFFKGALLNDANCVLIQQTENVQSGRQIRFTSLKEIIKQESIIKAYIYEAIEVERLGLKVELKKTEDFSFPEELQKAFDANSKFKNAFEKLTPGRQKGYLLFFAGAKQSKTREERIEKNKKRILDGIGLNDCTCGLSQRMPNCDGSHNKLKVK